MASRMFSKSFKKNWLSDISCLPVVLVSVGGGLGLASFFSSRKLMHHPDVHLAANKRDIVCNDATAEQAHVFRKGERVWKDRLQFVNKFNGLMHEPVMLPKGADDKENAEKGVF